MTIYLYLAKYIKFIISILFMTEEIKEKSSYIIDGKFDFKKYREENKEQINTRMQKYRETNREIINKKSKAYYENNKDVINAKRREKYAKDKSPKATAFL